MTQPNDYKVPLKTKLIFSLISTIITSALFALFSYYIMEIYFSYLKIGVFAIVLFNVTFFSSPLYLKKRA
jgi:hypothetical protein